MERLYQLPTNLRDHRLSPQRELRRKISIYLVILGVFDTKVWSFWENQRQPLNAYPPFTTAQEILVLVQLGDGLMLPSIRLH